MNIESEKLPAPLDPLNENYYHATPMSEEATMDYCYRPLLRRLVDGFGGLGQRLGAGKRQFDDRALIQLARDRTGLNDFGPPPVDHPVELLCQGYDRDAQLTFAGRLAARHHLLQLLINRLELTQYRTANPSIATLAIERPIFVLGLPRSGTTLLHGLLAQDPRHRCPKTWEVMYPCPPPHLESADTDPRITKTDKQLGWLEHLAPGFKTIHPIGAMLPQECIAITAHAFMSLEFHTTNNVPQYQSWFEAQDLTEAYTFHRAFLQHLQWKNQRDRWVLKAPDHLRGLRALLGIYPDAIIVQTHRDPMQVTASIASHGNVIRAGFSNHIEPESIAHEWSDYWRDSLRTCLEVREQSQNNQFVDVYYKELLRNPLDTVAKLYEQLGIEFSDTAKKAMHDFLNQNPQDKHGRHRYSLAQFSFDSEELRKSYAFYYEKFAVV